MFDSECNRLLYGSEAPLPERIPLRAGPLSLVFEAGDLRYLSLGSHEAIRRVYGAVRDRDWGTVPGLTTNLALVPVQREGGGGSDRQARGRRPAARGRDRLARHAPPRRHAEAPALRAHRR